MNALADVGMHQYAYSGWSAFLPLRVPERAPRLRMATLLDRDSRYLEGMRPEESGLLTTFDYWRMYEDGIGCSAEGYREDFREPPELYFDVSSSVARLHSILAHGRLVGQQLPEVEKILFHMDWRGVAGPVLCASGSMRPISPMKIRGDRFIKTIVLDWRELRDDYFAALKRVSLPFFDLFTILGAFDPNEWFTKEMVEGEIECDRSTYAPVRGLSSMQAARVQIELEENPARTITTAESTNFKDVAVRHLIMRH